MGWSWLWRRLASVVVVLLLVSFAAYALLDLLPGSTATAILGTGATPDAVAQVEADLHLDRPMPVRYMLWLQRAVNGDLGVSYQSGEVINTAVRPRVGMSLELLVLTQLFAAGVALPLSLLAARNENGRLDRLVSAGSFVAIALPQVAFGIILLTVFAVKLRWFPATRYVPFGTSPVQNLRALVLPVLSLGLPLAGIYTRVLRTDLLQTMASDHITFARAMGLPTRRVLLGRVLRPSSLTLVSVIGLNTAFVLGGAAIVEQLFSLPGVGSFLLRAVLFRDFVKVQAAVLVIAVIYVVVNLAIDVALTLLDPRIRLTRSGK